MSTKSDIIKRELYDLYSIDDENKKKFVIDINVDSIIHENQRNSRSLYYKERKT